LVIDYDPNEFSHFQCYKLSDTEYVIPAFSVLKMVNQEPELILSKEANAVINLGPPLAEDQL
jgi:hypothetical protein